MAEAAWTLCGQYMESCNCDYLCPCIYTNPQGPATHDHCYAMMVYRIDKGRVGEVTLDELPFAFVIRSGKVMADGGWIFACVVDEAADEAQRAALLGAFEQAAGANGLDLCFQREGGDDPFDLLVVLVALLVLLVLLLI